MKNSHHKSGTGCCLMAAPATPPVEVVSKLLKAQHTRCEAHRLWACALEETLAGQVSMTTYGATTNTLIAAMSNTSALFREVRDAPTPSSPGRQLVQKWADDVQRLEKDLYDATVALQQVSLTHAAARCEEAIVVKPEHQSDPTVLCSSSSSEGGAHAHSLQPRYAPHCADCSIAGLVASLHRGVSGSAASASVVSDDLIPTPAIAQSWSTMDDRNQCLFPVNSTHHESGVSSGVPADDEDDDDSGDAGTTRQHQRSSHSCRVASEECARLRANVSVLQRRIGDMMDEAMELIVDGGEESPT
jgi:hypothetical protein